MDKRISRFYCNLNKEKNEHLLEKELDEDFDSDELENYSEDEIESDEQDMLNEDNKQISYWHAK